MESNLKNSISVWILVLVAIGSGLYITYDRYFKSFGEFINSNFFIALITLLVGGIAIFLYLKQKWDTKIQAARVLLIEIRTAEDRIVQIKEKIESHNTDDFPSVFPTKSWKKYSNLFVGDFDVDEMKLISTFYDYCELIEEFCRRNNQFFWITTEERARVVQQSVGQLLIEAKGIPSESDKEVIEKISNHNFGMYAPYKPIGSIEKYLSKVVSVTTTIAGEKLKRLAKMK